MTVDKLAISFALIFAIDYPLDMCHTVINLTCNAVVTVLVIKSMGRMQMQESKPP